MTIWSSVGKSLQTFLWRLIFLAGLGYTFLMRKYLILISLVLWQISAVFAGADYTPGRIIVKLTAKAFEELKELVEYAEPDYLAHIQNGK